MRPAVSRLVTGLGPLGMPLLLNAAFVVAGTALGSSFIPLGKTAAALFGMSDGFEKVIVWTLRLPRVGVALLGGGALALSGAILQRVVRNPLASPSVLGICDGAALGVLTFLTLFSDRNNNLTTSIHWMPLWAVMGAALLAFVVAAATWVDPKKDAMRVVLYGIAFAALAKALVVLMMILGPVFRAGQALTWLTGTVGAAHWDDVAILAVVLTASSFCLGLLASGLRQLLLDPLTARASGLSLSSMQIMALVLAVVLAAAAVSQTGAVGFVGLVAPHLARRLIPEVRFAYWPACFLAGSALLLGADIAARLIAPPLELPAGALTALIGAPLFLYLLMRERRTHA